MAQPQLLSAALAELIAARGFARKQGDAALQAAWQQAAGPHWSTMTRPGRIVRGVLQVTVTSPAAMSELVSFQSVEILQTLQQSAPHLRIKNLKFKLG